MDLNRAAAEATWSEGLSLMLRLKFVVEVGELVAWWLFLPPEPVDPSDDPELEDDPVVELEDPVEFWEGDDAGLWCPNEWRDEWKRAAAEEAALFDGFIRGREGERGDIDNPYGEKAVKAFSPWWYSWLAASPPDNCEGSKSPAAWERALCDPNCGGKSEGWKRGFPAPKKEGARTEAAEEEVFPGWLPAKGIEDRLEECCDSLLRLLWREGWLNGDDEDEIRGWGESLEEDLLFKWFKWGERPRWWTGCWWDALESLEEGIEGDPRWWWAEGSLVWGGDGEDRMEWESWSDFSLFASEQLLLSSILLFALIWSAWSWIRQWILNQFDLLPYREPDLDIPTVRHFLSLQLLQEVRFFLLMTHWPLFLQSPKAERLLYVRPKKDLQPSHVKAPKWYPAAGSPHTLHNWFIFDWLLCRWSISNIVGRRWLVWWGWVESNSPFRNQSMLSNKVQVEGQLLSLVFYQRRKEK